jgi:hypothetical protein
MTFLAPGKANNTKAARHLVIAMQMVESRDEFARGQVAACAEDDDGTVLERPSAVVEPAGHEVIE